jgi:hypothetical protein
MVDNVVAISGSPRTAKSTIKRLLLGFLLTSSLANLGWCDDGPFSRATLKGITAVSVVIRNLGPKLPGGLAREQLQAEVESKLRIAGITVLTFDQPGPYLGVEVTIDASNDIAGAQTFYFYDMNIELHQSVLLDRNNAIRADAPTWSLGAIGVSADGPRATRAIRDFIRDAVDRFLDAYLSVNPKLP